MAHLKYRSLIAAFLGNVVGALLVGLPAVYLYLGDYGAGGLLNAENGEVESNSQLSKEDEKKRP